MASRFKIPAPIAVRWDDAESYGQPPVGWGSKHIGGSLWQIRVVIQH
jgi:hypothetical protein